jgi:hypothetical protein
MSEWEWLLFNVDWLIDCLLFNIKWAVSISAIFLLQMYKRKVAMDGYTVKPAVVTTSIKQ